MKGIFKRILKSGISSMLALSMFTTMIQFPAKAEAADVYLPETEIGEDILSNDVFYFRDMLPRFKPVAGDTRQQADNGHDNSPPIHKA